MRVTDKLVQSCIVPIENPFSTTKFVQGRYIFVWAFMCLFEPYSMHY